MIDYKRTQSAALRFSTLTLSSNLLNTGDALIRMSREKAEEINITRRSDTLTTARRVNTGSYRLVRLGDAASNGLKIR